MLDYDMDVTATGDEWITALDMANDKLQEAAEERDYERIQNVAQLIHRISIEIEQSAFNYAAELDSED